MFRSYEDTYKQTSRLIYKHTIGLNTLIFGGGLKTTTVNKTNGTNCTSITKATNHAAH